MAKATITPNDFESFCRDRIDDIEPAEWAEKNGVPVEMLLSINNSLLGVSKELMRAGDNPYMIMAAVTLTAFTIGWEAALHFRAAD